MESDIPARLVQQSTVFDAKNVSTDYDQTLALADLTGISSHRLSRFRLERLLIHELLIRVTCDLSVPDGPEYEALGLNLRGMVSRLYDRHFQSKLPGLERSHNELLQRAEVKMAAFLKQDQKQTNPAEVGGWLKPLRALLKKPSSANHASTNRELVLDQVLDNAKKDGGPLEKACALALQRILDAYRGRQGFLPRENTMLIDAALNLFSNDFGAQNLRGLIEEDFLTAAMAEGFDLLPTQKKPVVLNVKGASAAGKSTIRPQQRQLAEGLGIPWEQFALVSPDYWRKYLLDYEALGDDFKYGAMLTGRELELIDQKLDRYMAEKAQKGSMPHLLVDRFRFDSFSRTDEIGQGSNLLSRFGDTIYLFFMITPPEETVERAWNRGIATGRYKAVDDLLYHNVEAYCGIPNLFFSWALSKKKVHWEFLDNDVPEGSNPRSVAFGWNAEMTILDMQKLEDIDRYQAINVDASDKSALYEDMKISRDRMGSFLVDCLRRMKRVSFVDPVSGNMDVVVENQHARFLSTPNTSRQPALGRLKMIINDMGYELEEVKSLLPLDVFLDEDAGKQTLGRWIGNS